MGGGGEKRRRAFPCLLIAAAVFSLVTFRSLIAADPASGARAADALRSYDRGFSITLVAAAKERTKHKVAYDGSYRVIEYPNGDVPDNIGVCADVVVRAYRKAGIDLQKEIHEDMVEDFGAYPDRWGLKKPDPNIDHRRVLNLRVFFGRHGVMLPVTRNKGDYLPGDLVTWTVAKRLPHIGIVADRRTLSGCPLIIHNIGRGPVMEDILFDYPITGHYRYYGQ